MADINSNIAAVAADLDKFKGDFTGFLADFAGFSSAVQAFITSASQPSTATVLSPEDAAALAAIDASLKDLDAAASSADASLKAVVVPEPK